MKQLPFVIVLLLLVSPLPAQEVEYRIDEECNCEQVFIDGIQTTRQDDRYGFSRADGTVIAEPVYKYVDHFHGRYCKVYADDDSCGLIDRDGRVILPCVYEDVSYPSGGRIPFRQNGRIGYADLEGRVVISPIYIGATEFNEGTACVKMVIDSLTDACTFIDTMGHPLFPPIFQNGRPFHDGYAAVLRYDRWGVINLDGVEVVPCMYEYITVPDQGYFFAGDEFGMALFDYSMHPQTPFKYMQPQTASWNRILVRDTEGKYGFLSPQGREVLPTIYDDAYSFWNGYAHVAKDGKHGIIDTNGRFVLPMIYDDTHPRGGKYEFNDSVALFEVKGKLGFIHLNGEVVMRPILDDAYPFSQGLAAAGAISTPTATSTFPPSSTLPPPSRRGVPRSITRACNVMWTSRADASETAKE